MKTKIQKPRSALVLMLTLCSALVLFAFRSTNEMLTNGTQVEYDVMTETTYVIPESVEIENLAPLDASRLRKKNKSMHFKKEVGTNGKPVTTITQITDSQLESWMPQISKIEYDENGSKIFGENGELINQRAYSDRELNIQEVLDVNPLEFGKQRILQQPNIQQVMAMEGEGFEVAMISDVETSFSRGNTKLIQNIDRLSLDRRHYENGQLKYRKQTKYLPTIDGQYMIPSYDIHRKKMTLPGGTCVEEVTKKYYLNYRINGQSPIATAMAANNDQFEKSQKQFKQSTFKMSIFPNPVSEELQVKLMGDLMMDDVEIQVINVLGQSILKKQHTGGHPIVTLNVKHLPKGTYFVQIGQGDSKWSKRFVKS